MPALAVARFPLPAARRLPLPRDPGSVCSRSQWPSHRELAGHGLESPARDVQSPWWVRRRYWDLLRKLGRFWQRWENTHVTTNNNSQPNPHLDALLAEAGWVLKLAKRLARDQAAAEDIAQSTLALALEKRPDTDGGLRPWLARVVGRLASHRVRGDARRQAREAVVTSSRGSESAGSDEALIRFELQQDLSKRVDALPEPYRRTLIYRFYEGLSIKEIAKELGVPPSTVRSQLARGLERIRLQYNHESEGRSALGVFLVAANSSTHFITRRTAEIALMQTSTKYAIVGVAALIAVTAFFVPDFAYSEPSQPDTVETTLVHTEPAALVEGEQTLPVGEPAEEDRRVAVLGVAPSAAPEVAIEQVEPTVSTLRVRILDANRLPLAGATLSSIHPDGRPRGTNGSASSDNEGRAVLKLNDASMRKSGDDLYDMTFAVAAAGHGTEFVIKQPILHGDTDLGDVQLGPGGSIVGLTVDALGRGVAGAVLYAGANETGDDLAGLRITGPAIGSARPSALSMADGSFEISGISAQPKESGDPSVRLWAHAAGGLWTITEPITMTPRGRIDLGRVLLEEAPGELRIVGTVFRPSGLPAAGALVDFFSRGAPHVGQVIADAQGVFIVIPKTGAPMEFVARDAAVEFGISHSQIATRGESIELKLLERRIMTLTIKDTDGEPVRDAHIMPVLAGGSGASEDDGRLVPGVGWLYSDEAGRVDIEVPGQRFKVVVRKYGAGIFDQGPFEPDTAPLALSVTIPVGYEVIGRVLAYGVPVAGAKVAAMMRHDHFAAMTGGFPNRYPSGVSTVVTDSEGRFTAPLKLNWRAIGVLATKDGLATGEITPDILPGGKIRGVEIHMTEGGAIEGVVIAPPNMGPEGLIVGASRGDGLPLSTFTDAKGRYRFEGLTPGNWRVEGRLNEVRTELLSISYREDDMDPQWNAFVVDRKTLGLEVDMRHLVDVQVKGLLLIDGAAPLPGWSAEVVLPVHARGPAEVGAVALDSHGRFTLTTTSGRGDLRLVGPVQGGATVEVLREIRFEGPLLDWEETLQTALVQQSVEGGFKRARFVRGDPNEGDRELAIVPVDEYGAVMARVPVGPSILEVPEKSDPSGRSWDALRTVDIH
jgi:RNA polymerase sigma factor (sigma-70 family)